MGRHVWRHCLTKVVGLSRVPLRMCLDMSIAALRRVRTRIAIRSMLIFGVGCCIWLCFVTLGLAGGLTLAQKQQQAAKYGQLKYALCSMGL